MNNNETVIITAQDIGDMLLFADDVLEAMDMNAMKYDENGVFILSKYENYDDAMREITGNMQNAAGYSFLYELYRDERYRLDEMRDMNADDMLKILPQELTRKAVGIFRNGVELDERKMSPDITDRYLSELFAMKVREMMIHFAAGRS